MSCNVYRVVVKHDNGEEAFDLVAKAITDAYTEGRQAFGNLFPKYRLQSISVEFLRVEE